MIYIDNDKTIGVRVRGSGLIDIVDGHEDHAYIRVDATEAERLAIALVQATPPDDQQEADVSDGDEDHLLLFGRTEIHRDDAIRLGLALIRAAKEAK